MRGKGEGSIFKDSRGLWTAVIELPAHPTGGRRRKVLRRKSKLVLMQDLKAWRVQFEKDGDLPTKDISVGEWMREWFEKVAVESIRPKTAMAYKSLIDNHIIPALGKKRLHKLTAADVRRLATTITGAGLSQNTALQAHRILSVALKQAEREGRVPRNVATLTDAPRRPRHAQQALDVDQGIQVIKTAAADPLGSLWAAVLLTGARQGELLGLELDRVSDRLDISWQLQRITWQHGCNPHCGRIRGWDCRDKKIVAPADWEHRHMTGGLWLSRPKSKSGWRVVPLVDPLASILARHIEATAEQPNPHGLVWHTPDGSPIDPKDQSAAWHTLLARAKVPDVPLHSGRHTTVDLLYEAGVPEDVISDIVGHSSRSMTRAYKSRGLQQRHTDAMHSLSALFTPPDDARSDTPEAIAP